MSDTQAQQIEELRKYFTDKGFTVFVYNDEIVTFEHFVETCDKMIYSHHIYLPVKYLSKLDTEQKLSIFNASHFSDISKVIRPRFCNYTTYVISANKSLDCERIYRNVKMTYDNSMINLEPHEYVLIYLKPERETIYGRDTQELVKVQPIMLEYIPTFKVKFNIPDNAKHNYLPIECLKKKEYGTELSVTSLHFSLNKENVFDTLQRRYQFNTNKIIYTNDITDKSNVYSIMDKNILRGFNSLDENVAAYNKNLVILNPNLSFFAQSINKTIPIEHLLALFDIDEKELKANMKKVSYLTNPIVSLGLGGLMSNFLYWSDRLREYFGLDYLFKQLVVFEPDTLEFSNLFRIPLNWKDFKIPEPVENRSLSLFLDPKLSLKYDNKYNKLLLLQSVRNLSPKIRQFVDEFKRIELKNCVLIGAPDLNTRKAIFNSYSDNDYYNISFLCTTHINNTFSIDVFPDFDRELVVETYGSIDLNKFLLNMFRMTVELIRILANKEFVGKVKHKFLDYSVDNEDFKANSNKHKCLKNIVYTFN